MKKIPNKNFEVDVKIEPWSYNSGATVHLDVTNIGKNEISEAKIKFTSDFQIKDLPTDIWDAEIVSEKSKGKKYEYVLSLNNNPDLAPGEKHYFGFNTLDYTPEFEYISLHSANTNKGANTNKKPTVKKPIVEEPIGGGTTSGDVERPDYNKSSGFFTLNGKVYDANGNEFIARGVNNRHVWFDNDGTTEAIDALDNIAGFGFNSVRIVWQADDEVNPTDAILERAIQTTINNKMVPMVELHDFTGQESANDLLNRGVNWWTDRAATWQKYEDSLMINIANEFGGWQIAKSEFPRVYKDAITRIRNAGINNTLVIDGFVWGKDDETIAQYGQEIYNHDPQKNVIFSIHFYCGDGENPSQIAEAFDNITGQGLPMIVGEFGPTHSPCGDVREDVIMAEAEERGVGYYPWAWDDAEWALAANGNWEADSYDELTQFGKDVIYGPNGIQETSEIATIFEDF